MCPEVPRPVLELKGFEKVWVRAGETKRVALELENINFTCFDVAKKSWVVKPGKLGINVGSSSRLIRFSREVTLSE